MMRPFFSYYGGKWRAAPKYHAPEHKCIVEPFAGSAGYSTRYWDRDVALIDLDPVICDVWDYLIHASARDVRSLPTDIQSVDDVHGPSGAKSLVGFWLNKGSSRPRRRPSAWMRKGTHATSFWGSNIRSRIENQVGLIRHWTIRQGTYRDAPDMEATWFIDPPYERAGRHYHYGSEGIDYVDLAEWSRSRIGLVMVCENAGAAWLPFSPFRSIKANESRHGGHRSEESLYWHRNKEAA